MEDAMEKLLEEKVRLEKLEAEVAESKERLGELATEVQSANGGSPSFKHGDKWYTVRRRAGKAYICEFDVKPGSWRKKDKPDV